MSDVVIDPQNSDKKLEVTSHRQYHTPDVLSPRTVAPSPLDQFHTWFAQAAEAGVAEPEAISLATVSASGVPSARTVLFKALDARGFTFYTNYTSRKSRELAENPHAALVFYWREVHRSVRVVGTAERVSREESAAYFASRPVGSRLGAWASRQSEVVQEGQVAERLAKVSEKFGVKEGDAEGDVPLPDFWGGWRVVPTEIEFWSGKPSRLHDRVRYLRTDEAADWKVDLLSP